MKITLESTDLSAALDSHGAELTSLKRIGSDVEYLWQAGPVWPRHAPVLFPIVGRLANDTALIGGHLCQMNQHGFARDMEFEIENHSRAEAVLVLKYNEETLTRFPFQFQLRIRYRLEGDTLHVRYSVSNVDAQTMWFSIGAHPAFNCIPDPDGATAYELEFNREETTDRHFLDHGLQSGRTERILTHSRILKLSPGLFTDDAIIFKNLRSSEITLRKTDGQPVVSVSFEGFPFLGIWSKPGVPFVCIEPWFGIADRQDHGADFENKEGILTLAPGNLFECEYLIRPFPV